MPADTKPIESAALAAVSSASSAQEQSPSPDSTRTDLTLDSGWALGIARLQHGVALQLSHPLQESVELEITITPRGPVVRARATALLLETTDEISARCERFSVEARQSITLRANEIRQEATGTLRIAGSEVAVQATVGSLRASANDDVQLLGEQILLNCEREPPLPQWLAPVVAPENMLPRQHEYGNSEIFDHLEPKKTNAD